jgi:hypothetical protein
MRYEELFKEMEQLQYTLNEPYVFWDYEGTSDILAEAYCNAHGINNLKSIEDARIKFKLYLEPIALLPLEKLTEDGNLKLIGERFQENIAAFLDIHVDAWSTFIKDYNLTSKLDFYMCINFKNVHFDLQDLFVEFCAFQYYEECRNKRTIKQYCGLFNYFTDELKFTKLSNIEAKDLDRFFRTDLLSYEMRLPWFKRIMSFYKTLFSFGVERGICAKNPMDTIDITEYYPLCHFRFNPAFLTEDNGG